MLHIAICDDDLILSKTLYQFIFETYRDIDLFIDQYDSGEEFLNKIISSNKTYDLLPVSYTHLLQKCICLIKLCLLYEINLWQTRY